MGSSSQLLSIPLPRRLNSDIAPSLLAPDETPRLHNVMPRKLPQELKPRNGVAHLASWGQKNGATSGTTLFKDASAAWVPYHAIVSPDSTKMVVFLVEQTVTASVPTPDWTFYYTPAEVDTLGASGVKFLYENGTGSPPYKTGYVVVDLTSSTVYGKQWQDIYDSGFQAWGAPVYYDGCVFWTSMADSYYSSPETKYWDGTKTWKRLTIDGTAQPQLWGGAIDTTEAAGALGQAHTTTATVSNASTTVTLAAAPSYSLTGFIMRIAPGATVGTNGCPSPAYQFQYRVKSHAASSTTLELDRPYGLGESTGNVPNLAACSVDFFQCDEVGNAIPGAATLAVYRDRLFAARGTISQTLSTGASGASTAQQYPYPVGEYGGVYGNALTWSNPGNWNRWPDQNFVIVDQDANDPVTGLITLGDVLVVFKANRMFVLTGYDEDSFQIQKISDVVGCPYPSGMVVYEGTLFFCNQEGVFAFDGQNLRSISQPGRSAGGISELWASRAWSSVQECPPTYFWPTMAVTPDAHLLIACHYPLTTTDYADNFCYDIKNDAWVTWGMADATRNPIRVVNAPNGRVYGVHRWYVSDLTNMFNPAAANYTPMFDSHPALADDAVTESAVVPEVEIWMQPMPGQTVRLREVQIDHKVHYAHTTGGLSYAPWTFRLASDPDLTLSATQHSINARWIDSSGYDITAPRHFSDRFPETWQREGQAIRIRLTGTTYPSAEAAQRMQDYTIYTIKLLVDRVRTMGVDNSAT